MKNGHYTRQLAKWAERRKKIKAFHNAGNSLTDTAKRFKISVVRVSQIVK